MGGDCDDVGALFILHDAVERGEERLLATMGCVSAKAISRPWTRSFTLTGCGHAMTASWGRVRDQGTFVSQPVTGDAAISVRLTSLAPNVVGPSYQWDHRPPSVAGLMTREALTEKCGHYVLIQVEASGSLVCRWRNKSGDQDDNQKMDSGKVTLPIHLKLVQAGGQTQVFTSTDGRAQGEPRMVLPTTFDDQSRVRLFVCSGDTFASSTAVFDAVQGAR